MIALFWTRHWKTILLVSSCTLAGGALLADAYIRGAASVKPKLAVAEGHSAVATTNDANAKDALTATSERHKVDVTIRAIERETGNVVAEAHIKGDINGAIDGWASGIAQMRSIGASERSSDRMRGVGQADPNADPHQRP